MIDIQKIRAIDVHTHAEVSCTQPHDDFRPELDEAFAKYFKSDKRPTMQETADFYRDQNLALVMFTIDSEHEVGKRRIPNTEVAECALKNDDVTKAGWALVRPVISSRIMESKGLSFIRRCRAFTHRTRWPIIYTR